MMAQLLRRVGLEAQPLPRTASNLFDVDTPTDLVILSLQPGAGPRSRAYLDSLKLDSSRMREATSFLTDPMAQVVVAGRVGSYIWSRLEEDTACRMRIISEERGMHAWGRGEVRSILGFYLEEVGPGRFFQSIAQLGDAAFIDTRVIFDHLRLDASRRDRFLSDMGRPEEIGDSLIREFTEAQMEARIPVILGGHSLVAGGMLALIDVSWLDVDKLGSVM